MVQVRQSFASEREQVRDGNEFAAEVGQGIESEIQMLSNYK